MELCQSMMMICEKKLYHANISTIILGVLGYYSSEILSNCSIKVKVGKTHFCKHLCRIF